VVVLDGDARVGPAFLRTLAGYLAAGAVAVTARRRTSLEAATWLTRAQASEQAQDGAIQRGRWASGGCSELRGNGMTIRRNALAAVGGWRAEELTEDLDLSSRLAARLGVTVAWAIDAVVTEEPVRHWRALWRQRLRWAEGGIRRALEHGPEVLASPLLPLRAKLDFASYVLQVAAAPVIVGAIAGAISTGRVASTALLLAGYLASSALLAWVGLGREAAVDGATLGSVARANGALRASLFGFLWLAAIPAAFARLAGRRGALTFAKTARTLPTTSPATVEPEPLARPR
jgi:1,2-diacylglycerol 3-beta-glucosyltransferase